MPNEMQNDQGNNPNLQISAMFIIYDDGQKLQAAKLRYDMTLASLRIKIASRLGNYKLFLFKGAIIQANDELGTLVQDIVELEGELKKISLKTCYDRITIDKNGVKSIIEAPLSFTLSELRNLHPAVLPLDLNFFWLGALIERRDEIDITAADIVVNNTLFINKEEMVIVQNVPTPQTLMGIRIRSFLNVMAVTQNVFLNEPLDPSGNPASSRFDLGIDGAFTEYQVLIGVFYLGEGLPDSVQFKTAKLSLESKGFLKVTVVLDEESFTNLLPQYNCAWVISNSSWVKGDQQKFLQAIQVHLSKKKGLMVWGDNVPYFFHMDAGNGVKIKLVGNSYGTKILTRGEAKTGQFAPHQITTGILKMNEGVTICNPVNSQTNQPNNLGKFEVIGIGSSGLPAYIALEGNNSRGRIIVDCGFTKLMPQYWDGNWRYVRNCTIWLLWMEEFLQSQQLQVENQN